MIENFVPFSPLQHRIGKKYLELNPKQNILPIDKGPAPLQLPEQDQPLNMKKNFKDLYLEKRRELQESAEGMETIMVRRLLKVMRQTIPVPDAETDYFGKNSHATKTFQQMMDDSLATNISSGADFGIGQRIFDENINEVTRKFFEQNTYVPYGLPIHRKTFVG